MKQSLERIYGDTVECAHMRARNPPQVVVPGPDATEVNARATGT